MAQTIFERMDALAEEKERMEAEAQRLQQTAGDAIPEMPPNVRKRTIYRGDGEVIVTEQVIDKGDEYVKPADLIPGDYVVEGKNPITGNMVLVSTTILETGPIVLMGTAKMPQGTLDEFLRKNTDLRWRRVADDNQESPKEPEPQAQEPVADSKAFIDSCREVARRAKERRDDPRFSVLVLFFEKINFMCRLLALADIAYSCFDDPPSKTLPGYSLVEENFAKAICLIMSLAYENGYRVPEAILAILESSE